MSYDPVLIEYSRLASIYDRRWSFYIDATIKKTISLCEIKPQERILDLGCGTGTLIKYTLDLVPSAKFVGIDPCVEMLNVAKEKLPPEVELYVGNSENLPFANESFEVVISTSAFHYFRNPSKAIQEAKRVLKPNGRLVITDWCGDYLTCRLLDFFLRLFNRSHFRTYGVRELQLMLETEGLDKISIERYKIDWFWGMMSAVAASC